MLQKLNLSGAWTFASSGFDAKNAPRGVWLKAVVPGNVHTDLMAVGKLEDPLVSRNEEKAAWVEQRDWWYRREFKAEASLLACPKVFLVAAGIDTVADLSLNGKKIGSAANMHIGHRWEVSSYLKKGHNRLEIRLVSPVLEAERLQKKRGSWPGVNFDPANWLRKALYAFGWDWGPRMATSGIFKDITLEALDGEALRSLFVKTDHLSASEALGSVELEIESTRARKAELHLRLGNWTCKKRLNLKAGRQFVRTRFKIEKPRAWWPRGFGEPFLYEAQAMLDSGESLSQKVGLRTVELDTTADKAGARFALKVNGTAVFCQGANWIPADSFLGRLKDSRVEKLLKMAADQGMNMMRVWGGGTYESEFFYNRCDKLGLLVWQDFAFGCNEVPETIAYEKAVKHEAEIAVTRIRQHPSIALWCGNNENYMARHDRWFKDRHRDKWGRLYYEKTLPAVVRRLDPRTPYWPGSPYGGSEPNSQSHGDRHNWDVWHGAGNYLEYLKDKSRFVSEFGFAALPNTRTLENSVPKEERWLQSKTMQAHDKTVAGYRRIVGHFVDHLPLGGQLDLETLRYLSQVNQAEALSTGIEHWRRQAPHTMGALYWQWNDCWPTTSWAVVDGEDRLRLAAHAVRRSFKDCLLSGVVKDGDELWSVPGSFPKLNCDGLCQFWLHAQGHLAVKGELKIERWGPRGLEKRVALVAVSQSAGKGVLLWEARQSLCGIKDRSRQFLVASLRLPGGEIQRSLFMERPRHLELSPARVQVSVKNEVRGQKLVLKAANLIKSIELAAALDGDFSDNGFDLLPGERKELFFTPRGKGRLTKKQISWRSLNDLNPRR